MTISFDLDQLLIRLTPLALDGAYANVPVPPDLDLARADDLQLATHGLLWLRELAASDDQETQAFVSDLLDRLPTADWSTSGGTVQEGRTNLVPINNWAGGVLNCPNAPFTMPAGSPLDAYTTPAQQHVHYVGNDGHIHELFFEGTAWRNIDLTKEAKATAALAVGALAGYATADPDVQHIQYVGPDASIHQLFWDGVTWRHDTPGRDAGAPAVGNASAIAAYASGQPDQQHVVYLGTDTSLHELVYDGGAWHWTPLSDAAHATVAPHAWSDLVGLETPWDRQHHVFYLGDDSHVHELNYDGSWTPHDLTRDSAAPKPAAFHSALHAYISEAPDQIHVVYLDDLGHVHELTYDGGWVDHDLTATWSAPLARADSPLHGFTTTGQQHIVYVGADAHVHQLYFDAGRWVPQDLSAAGGGPDLAAGTHLTGYATGDPDQQHVNYVGVDLHVHELLFNQGGWSDTDLTPFAFTPLVTAVGQWTVPSVSRPDYDFAPGDGWESSTWVGIDGWQGATLPTNDVLQAGTRQEVDGSDTKYIAWYEWFCTVDGPNTPRYRDEVDLDDRNLSPGDQMLCVVSYLDVLAGSLLLYNLTQGWVESVTLVAPPGAAFSGGCAEWIMETPSKHGISAALPAFTPVRFTSASAYDDLGTKQDTSTATALPIVLGDPSKPWSPKLTAVALAPTQVTITFLPWHDTDLNQAAPGASVPVAGPLCGYASEAPDQLHIDYVGSDGDLHEFVYDGGSWSVQDLSTAAAAPVAPTAGTALTGYTAAGQQHVDYVGVDGHVHELMFDGGWHPNDLNAAAGTATAAQPGRLVGFTSTAPDQQHVCYVGTDGIVYELTYDGGSWTGRPLTVAGAVAPGSGLAGYATDGDLHVIHTGPDGHVYELLFSGGGWAPPHDLTADSGAPVLVAPGSALVGYRSFAPDQQHICFLGPAGDVHELLFDGGVWSYHDLSADGAVPVAADPASALVGYASIGPAQLHVEFVGADAHLHEIVHDGGGWQHTDLSVAAGGLTVFPNSLCGFPSDWNGQQHAGVRGTDGLVHELYF